MPVIISLINMKGGVGKTSLTVALAEFMALEHHLHILVIDLDPQSNASACLMDLQQWQRANMRGQSIMRLFLDSFQEIKVFSASESVVKNASNINGGINGLDLLPSGMELMDLQDALQTAYPEQNQIGPIYLLRDALQDILPDYDVVLIDCPPSLGLITQNGLAISDCYLMPVVPEIMSLHGIPQMVSRVNRLQRHAGLEIKPLGIVATRVREQNSDHPVNLADLRAGAQKKGYTRVFDTIIHESAAAANGINFSRAAASLRSKYGSGRTYQEYKDLTAEVLKYVGK